jgi:hypothetical protein
MFLQFVAALLFSMVAGSVFGIWRGYDPTTYAAATFLEMHQGAVRGLNALLPGLALVSILLTLALTWLARGKGVVFWLYLGALLLMVGGGTGISCALGSRYLALHCFSPPSSSIGRPCADAPRSERSEGPHRRLQSA